MGFYLKYLKWGLRDNCLQECYLTNEIRLICDRVYDSTTEEGPLTVDIAASVAKSESGLEFDNLVAATYSVTAVSGITGISGIFDNENFDVGGVEIGFGEDFTGVRGELPTFSYDSFFRGRDVEPGREVQMTAAMGAERSSFIILANREGSWALTLREIFGNSGFEVEGDVQMDDTMTVLVEWLDSKGLGRSVNIEINSDFLDGRNSLSSAPQIIAQVLRR